MQHKPKILFLCTGNSCRSQMAEGILRKLAGDRFEVYSAGTRPAGLNRQAVEAMGEIGIDISAQRSKSIDDFQGQSFAYVITVCDRARQECPVFPSGAVALHWGLEDPAAASGTLQQRREVFRRVRDEIHRRILNFLDVGPKKSASRQTEF